MKKNIRICIVLFLAGILLGCSHHVESGEITPAAGNGTTPSTEYSLEKLKELYPKWINTKGHIVYPYTSDSKEHLEANSNQELSKLYDIPKEIVDYMETEELLKAVEEYPLLDFSLFDNYMFAAEHYTNTFYAYRILQDRTDLYQAAWNALQRKKENEILEIKDELLQRAEINKIILDESLILLGEGSLHFDDAERKEILSQIESFHQQVEDVGERLGIRIYRLEEISSNISDQ